MFRTVRDNPGDDRPDNNSAGAAAGAPASTNRPVMRRCWRDRLASIRIPAPVLRFRRDQDGATAVEFAMVSVPFLGLLFAIFETAYVFFATQGVEAATADAARMIMTGQVQGMATITTAEQFRDSIICNPTAPRVRVLPDFIDCSKLIVDVQKAANFGSADMSKSYYTNPTMNYQPGGGCDIVVLRVVYPMPVYLSVLTMSGLGQTQQQVNTTGQTNYDGGWKHLLMGTAAYRNEPFATVGAYTNNC